MLRVVVDPNVFVSAIVKPDGVSAAVVRAGLSGRFRFVSSPALVEELADVLGRPKFTQFGTAEDMTAYVNAVAGVSEPFGDEPTSGPDVPDAGDQYLVDLASNALVDAIVSGDRALRGALESRVRVLSPGEFLALLDDES